jgi:hypothetical protein
MDRISLSKWGETDRLLLGAAEGLEWNEMRIVSVSRVEGWDFVGDDSEVGRKTQILRSFVCLL